MASQIPAKLRDAGIAQAARRATQLEKFKPIITYWLRFYITQKIITLGLHSADQECTTYTTELMEKLEQTKADHPAEDALLDEVAAHAYCEQFALQTFAKGDNDIRNNKVTASTADTLQAASTFLELLAVWRNPLEGEIQSKLKYAKYHAVRIVKALKNGEDPNLSNPAQETPPVASPAALDPNDPEVRAISDPPAMQNPYQSYVESAPNTDARPSPTSSVPRQASPMLPSAPSGYSQRDAAPTFPQHQDVSPISQPGNNSRQGSVVSVGGGYFPRVDVPTFTADNAAPGLPTAPLMDDEPMTEPYDPPSAPQPPQAPQGLQPSQAPQAPDPQSFYQHPTSPPLAQQPPTIHQPAPQVLPTQNPFQQQQPVFASPPPHQPPPFQPPPQQYQYSPQPPQPQAPPQTFAPPPQPQNHGPLNTDEEAIMDATKHAKWAISALNFEDVDTAVKELRVALRALGAN